MSADSKFEVIMAQLVAGVTGITSVKKVYDYLSDLGDGQPYPRVEVLNGDESMKPSDNGNTVWDSQFMVLLNAYAKPTEIEGIIHELRKYVVSVAISQINNATTRWNVVQAKGIEIARSNMPIVEKILWSQVRFTVHSRFLDTNL
jgi:hypothetical protein